jgi:hypothetical protein
MDLAVVNYNSNTVSILIQKNSPVINWFTPSRNTLNALMQATIEISFANDINSSTLTNSTVRIDGSLSGLHTSHFFYISNWRREIITPNKQFVYGEGPVSVCERR